MSYRVIVTGGRDWSDSEEAWLSLGSVLVQRRNFSIRNKTPLDLVIIHGDCSTGADAVASAWAVINGITEERYPADWATHGKAAGPIRNTDMVKRGADLCIAFWDGKSKGTLDCLSKAVRAGIKVRIVPQARS